MKERKSVENMDRSSMVPPSMDYEYFQGAENKPFEPEAREFSPANAWWLSEASFLSYCHPGFARMALKLAGFPGFRFFQGTGTECMVAWNDETVITAFRGTEMRSISFFYELITDLNAFPVEFEGGGNVHRGFRDALYEIWEDTEDGEEGLQSFLRSLTGDGPAAEDAGVGVGGPTPNKDTGRSLWLCGHSLGGALAALAFTLIPRAAGLYIYGAPRIGDGEFVRQSEGRQVFRVEHKLDPIPMVPPDLPRINLNFSDLGTLIYIDDRGVLKSSRPRFSLEKEKAMVQKMYRRQTKRRKNISGIAKGWWRRLVSHFKRSRREWSAYLSALEKKAGMDMSDHMPIHYVVSLWNHLLDSD
ncbi:lipase family protein [Salinispira pacifica]|nr:lipase family protein [Salinispira pacifica]